MSEAEDKLLMRYLLDLTSEEERARVEERVFADDGYFERLGSLEDELIDDYARDRLAADERARFENRYLTSARGRARLAFSRALRHNLDATPDAARPALSAPVADPTARTEGATRRRGFFSAFGAPRFAFAPTFAALALAAVLAAVIWYAVGRREPAADSRLARDEPRPTEQPRQLTPPSPEPSPRALATPGEDRVPPAQDSPAPPATAERDARPTPHATGRTRTRTPQPSALPSAPVVALALTTGAVRDGASHAATLRLPARARRVRLDLALDADEYAGYAATIATPDGAIVYRSPPLRARRGVSAPVVSVPLPASALKTGDYVVTLRATSGDAAPAETIGDYSFRIIRP